MLGKVRIVFGRCFDCAGRTYGLYDKPRCRRPRSRPPEAVGMVVRLAEFEVTIPVSIFLQSSPSLPPLCPAPFVPFTSLFHAPTIFISASSCFPFLPSFPPRLPALAVPFPPYVLWPRCPLPSFCFLQVLPHITSYFLHLLSPFPPCHCLAWLSVFCPRGPLPPSVRRVGVLAVHCHPHYRTILITRFSASWYRIIQYHPDATAQLP